jgi:chorismate synthase
MNTIGQLFRVTTFGESHGVAIGGIIDGCPPGIKLDLIAIQHLLDLRKPGQSKITTSRTEDDKVEFLSGIYNGTTLGTPIGFIIKNNNQNETDYEWLKNTYRPNHADFTYQKKMGIRDYRGGGRASARTTASLVVAGAIALQIINKLGIKILSFVSQLHEVNYVIEQSLLLKPITNLQYNAINKKLEQSSVRCIDKSIGIQMENTLLNLIKQGDTCGGVISTVLYNLPIGLGEPLFYKMQSAFANAMMSINAVHSFEYGSGLAGSKLTGTQNNDAFEINNKKVVTSTNNSGGIQGGISNGMPVYFNVGFKPIATVFKNQNTITNNNKSIKIKAQGRHDPCPVPRAVPIVKALSALVVLDLLMLNSKFTFK